MLVKVPFLLSGAFVGDNLFKENDKQAMVSMKTQLQVFRKEITHLLYNLLALTFIFSASVCESVALS